jgi:hypothetical protein
MGSLTKDCKAQQLLLVLLHTKKICQVPPVFQHSLSLVQTLPYLDTYRSRGLMMMMSYRMDLMRKFPRSKTTEMIPHEVFWEEIEGVFRVFK